MVSSVSSNVQTAWDKREASGVDQSKQPVDQIFPSNDKPKVDVTGLTQEGVAGEIAKTEAEIKELQAGKAANDKQILALQKEVEEIKKEISNLIASALEETEKYTKEQQEEIKKATDAVLAEYIAANGAMTPEQMQAKMAERVGSIDVELPAFIAGMLSQAGALIDKLMAKTQLLSTLVSIGECLSKKLNSKCDKLGTLEDQQEELKKQEEEKRKCDPIGFVIDGKICDFIIDRNGDNKFNNETEFLGAQNNWQEMVALDQKGNGDGILSREEMENSGVQVLVTNADGTQEIVSLADLGVESIDLSSYQNSNDTMGGGNQVLGTFGITVNGKTTSDGYNTLDTIDWLDKNYSNMFTDKAERAGRFATENGLAPSTNGQFNIDPKMLEVFELKKRLSDATTSIKSSFGSLSTIKDAALSTVAPTIETPEEKDPEKEPVV